MSENRTGERPETRRLVSGRLVGLRESVPWTSPLRIRNEAAGLDALVEVAADGSFALESRSPQVRTLPLLTARVLADDPGYLPFERPILLGGDAPVKIPAHCAAVLEGIVLDELHRPLASAEVEVFRRGAPSRGTLTSAARCRTDARGAYRLRAAMEGRCLVATCGRLDGNQPAGAEVEAWIGAVCEIPPLVLRRGHAISGRVRWKDGSTVAGVRIIAHADFRVPSVDLDVSGESIAWSGARMHFRHLETHTAADGSFSLEGLAADTTMTVEAYSPIKDSWVPGLTRGRSGSRVEAPRAGLEFEILGAPLDLLVVGPEGPLESFCVYCDTVALSAAAQGEGYRVLYPYHCRGVNGHARGIFPEERSLDFLVYAEGYRIQRVNHEMQGGERLDQLVVLLEPEEFHLPVEPGRFTDLEVFMHTR